MTRDPLDYGELESGRDCNYWEWDPTLRREARRVYPEEEFAWAESRLTAFGEVLGHEMADTADVIDRHPPELHTFDERGERVNRVEYHPAQFENERRVYEDFGLSHDPFHAPPGRADPVGFVHPLTMQTLLSYVDAGLTCPASMTVGAAIVLDRFDDGALESWFDGLTAREYDAHIEGAMFLTEKQGGSDVGANEVRAVPQDDGTYAIAGEKWFCSNIDAQGALVLARTPDAPEGTAGLSLFLVPRELPDGTLNDARFRRLKDKLGTRSVPTGEIEYEGATGYLVGEAERGFKYMAEMMNYERLTNATGAVGVMGRAILAAKVRAANREAFGDVLQTYPLMRRDLVDLTVEYEAAAAFSFEAARLYDRRFREGEDADAYKLMRLLVPVAKYKTARMAVDTTSYAMEILGGNGYVTGWVTERLLRDAQVLPIWEGPSNVLALDVLRALDREHAHEALIPYVADRLDGVTHPGLQDALAVVEDRFVELQTALGTLAAEDEAYAQYHAKRLADLLFDVVTAAVLLAEAQSRIEIAEDARTALVARRFVDTRFGDADAYGIVDGDRFGVEHFDAVARYAGVDPATLSETPAPADD